MNIKHSIFLPVIGFGLLLTTNYFQPVNTYSSRNESNKEQENFSLNAFLINSSWKFPDKDMKVSFINENELKLTNLSTNANLYGEYRVLFNRDLVMTIYKDRTDKFDVVLKEVVPAYDRLYATLKDKRVSLARVS